MVIKIKVKHWNFHGMEGQQYKVPNSCLSLQAVIPHLHVYLASLLVLLQDNTQDKTYPQIQLSSPTFSKFFIQTKLEVLQ